MLRGNRDFQLLYAGQVLSSIAGGSALFALPLLVLARTGSAAKAGLIGTITLVAYVAALLPLGTLADRLPTRAVLVGADLTRAVAAGALAIAIVADLVPFWLLLGFAVLDSASGTLFRAAGPAALKRVVPGDTLVTALSWIQARNSVAGLVGPPLGGLLLGVHPALPFAAKACAHLVSVGTVLAIRTRLPGRAEPSGRPWAELVAGLTFLWRDRFLRAALLTASTVNLAFGGVQTLVTLGGAASGVSSLSIGLVVGLAAGGGLVGTAAAPRLSRLVTPRQAFLIVLVGGAVAVPLMAVAPNPAVLGVLFAVCMVLPPVISVMVSAARIARTPDDLQGRTGSASALLATAFSAVAPLLAGLMIEHASAAVGFVALGALLTVLAGVAVANRALRSYTPSGTAGGRPLERAST